MTRTKQFWEIAFPRYTFGFTYKIAVKGFDLQLFIQGVGKKKSTFTWRTGGAVH